MQLADLQKEARSGLTAMRPDGALPSECAQSGKMEPCEILGR
jgi:hypothetical protein